MIVDTMTWEEVIRELRDDFSKEVYPMIDSRYETITKPFRKFLVKFKPSKWKMFTPYPYKSKRGNHFTVVFHCDGYDEFKKKDYLPSTSFILLRYKGLPYCIAYGDDKTGDNLKVFTSHCIKRYIERELKDETVSFEEAAMLLMTSHMQHYCMIQPNKSPKYENSIFVQFGNGVLLGNIIGEEGSKDVYYRTYLSKDIMKPNQLNMMKILNRQTQILDKLRISSTELMNFESYIEKHPENKHYLGRFIADTCMLNKGILNLFGSLDSEVNDLEDNNRSFLDEFFSLFDIPMTYDENCREYRDEDTIALGLYVMD